MKGYHFFLEYPSAKERRRATRKNLGNHIGTVIAVPPWKDRSWIPGPGMKMESVSAVQDIPNGGVCGSQCSQGYLDEKCLRVSESVAREIHPKIFTYLSFEK